MRGDLIWLMKETWVSLIGASLRTEIQGNVEVDVRNEPPNKW